MTLSKSARARRFRKHVGTLVMIACFSGGLAVTAPSASAAAPGPTWERSVVPMQMTGAAGGPDGSVVVIIREEVPVLTTVLRKYDRDGNVAWDAKAASFNNTMFASEAVAVLDDGSIVFAATFLNGSGITLDPAGVAVTVDGPFVARYLPDGTLSWVHEVTTGGTRGAYPDRVLQVLALPDGSARVAMEVARGTATFASLNGDQSATVTGAGAFVVDYQPDGSIASLSAVPEWIDDRFLYALAIGRAANGDTTMLATDNSNGSTKVVAQLAPNGAVVRTFDVGPEQDSNAAAAGVDGSLYGVMQLPTPCPTSNGPSTITVLARLAPDLSPVWLQSVAAVLRAIVPNRDGSIDVAGIAWNASTFGSGPEAASLDPTGFVGHLDPAGTLTQLGGHPTNSYLLVASAGDKVFGLGHTSQPLVTGGLALVEQFDRATIAIAGPGPLPLGCELILLTDQQAVPVAARPSFAG